MIKAIIVDDELHSLKMLHRQLNASGRVEVCASFTGPLEVLEYLKENTVDVAFLDIEMPDMCGLELAANILCQHGKILVVFVTAYCDYALEAFRINALDYLVKPVDTGSLNEALNRVAATLLAE